MELKIKLQKKEGSGVGANIEICTQSGEHVGGLTFHDHHDWQVTDSQEKYSWKEYYEPALVLARKKYPKG